MENKKRLISLDEALKSTHSEIYWTESQQAAVRSFLVKQPKVDAVEVVRCKNCESYDISGCYEGFGWCFLHDKGKTDNDYCSCGAKMDGDGNGK